MVVCGVWAVIFVFEGALPHRCCMNVENTWESFVAVGSGLTLAANPPADCYLLHTSSLASAQEEPDEVCLLCDSNLPDVGRGIVTCVSTVTISGTYVSHKVRACTAEYYLEDRMLRVFAGGEAGGLHVCLYFLFVVTVRPRVVLRWS